MRKRAVAIVIMLMVSSAAVAHREEYGSEDAVSSSGGGTNADVVVDLPPEVWTQNQQRQQNACLHCCTYENRSYSEGALVKSEGILLQCARDEKSLGTNNLMWKVLK